MNILVCISHVPDTTTKIAFDGAGTALSTPNVQYVIGPFDEYALSWAVGYKEKNASAKIVALCVGDASVEPTIRKALAIGADEGVRIDGTTRDPMSIARSIAAYAKDKNFDLIAMGKESIATNDAAVPAMVAELLGLPFVPYAAELTVEGGKAKVLREVDGGEEVMSVPTPLVISAQKGIAEWRIPNMRGIMAARTKPLATTPAAAGEAYVKALKYETPQGRQAVKLIPADQPEQLVQVLADKGVI